MNAWRLCIYVFLYWILKKVDKVLVSNVAPGLYLDSIMDSPSLSTDTIIYWRSLPLVITSGLNIYYPCACARDKVIDSVVVVVAVVSTKIAKSRKAGTWQCSIPPNSRQSRKLSSVCFKSLRTAHEYCKSCVFTGHAYWPHLPMPCAVSIAHARS